VLSCSAIGSPRTAGAQLNAFLERTGADELMVTAQIFDPEARERSYALLAEAVGLAPATPQLETAA
jgi:alkanesulfonate monooxygenase SsuD/methylene tetrahydromethanopterin reductase-like flavin-dependent oxidoreductase (luciferase family)